MGAVVLLVWLALATRSKYPGAGSYRLARRNVLIHWRRYRYLNGKDNPGQHRRRLHALWCAIETNHPSARRLNAGDLPVLRLAEAGGLLTFVACRQYKDPQGARIPVPTALLVRADEVTE